MHANGNSVTHFDSFGVEHIPEEIKWSIGKNDVITNIFRTQASDSIICEYFRKEFIDFMFKGQTLPNFANLFLPHNFDKSVKWFLIIF